MRAYTSTFGESWFTKECIQEMCLKCQWQEVATAWMCGFKDRALAKVIPRHQTCGTEESVEPLTLIDLERELK